MSRETIIAVQNLTLDIGRKRVLDAIDLQLRTGEAVVIAGRNGVGKSTLLRALAGVYVPDRGRVERSAGLAPGRVAFLSDALSFFSSWTLDQGIDFHCRVHGCPGYDDQLLRKVGLERSARVGSLSAGERVIFQLSLLLSQRPQLLLLDEILHLVDPYIRELALEELVGAIAGQEMALVMVNHTFSDTGRIPERLLLMDKGRFSLDIGTEELLQKTKKLAGSAPLPPELPSIFSRRLGDGSGSEHFIHPFDDSMRKLTALEFIDLSLDEIVKAFIGGLYENQRMA